MSVSQERLCSPEVTERVGAQCERLPEVGKRIPSLDGLRALAIGAVVLAHYSDHLRQFPVLSWRWFLEARGADGVGIFFVLSGFLITTLLVQEFEKSGTVSLRRFYFRRTFRIFPPLFFYLAFLLVFFAAMRWSYPFKSWLSAAFFVRDYATTPNWWPVEHTWSLSVEEQFYLLWPPALVWMLKRYGRETALLATLAAIVVCPFLRMGTHFVHWAAVEHREGIMLHTRMDALMCGCAVALALGNSRFERLYSALKKWWWLLPLEFLYLDGAANALLGDFYRFTAGLTINSVCIALFLIGSVREYRTRMGRVLNWGPIAYIGVVSYSIYLWQTFFIHPGNMTWLSARPWNLALILAAALVSFYVVEKPANALRNYLMRR